MELNKKRCIPCEGGLEPLSKNEAENLLKKTQGWEINNKGISNIKR